MKEICLVNFSEQDIKILEKLDNNILDKYINYLMDYKTVLWRHGDTRKLYSIKDLPYSNRQSLPEYPKEFLEFGKYFERICCDVSPCVSLEEEGFFGNEFTKYTGEGTFFSPSLIVLRIADAYHRDVFCDGLFSIGVDDHLYLKMVLHLSDCLDQYRASKTN